MNGIDNIYCMKNLLTVICYATLLSLFSLEARNDSLRTEFQQLFPENVFITEVSFVSDSVFYSYSDLPPFLRVAITAKPSSESAIQIEIWLPLHNWNGRFMGTGNGGGAGNINFWPLTVGVKRGFAVANTDMGTFPNANEMSAFPERQKDFGYRATHEMTAIGKTITTYFYKQKSAYSYFVGCSTGGQQALMEAQRYPDDYDGIIAGAPANNRTHLHTQFLWNYNATNAEPDCQFTKEQLIQIRDLILKTNVGKDGGAPDDNFLTDPRAAVIDYDKLDFLSNKQVEALKKIHQGPVNPITKERIYTPAPLGSEINGGGIDAQQQIDFTHHHFYPFLWTYGNDVDFKQFDFNKDVDKVDAALAERLNANNPNLNTFKENGGKLLMYTGTNDAIVPFQDAMHYYERVIAIQNGLEATQDFFRYFIIPGMGHCGGGPGLNECGQTANMNVPLDNEHDMVTALMNWVEKGIAPDQFIVTSYNENDAQKGIRMQRPVFPYPAFPEYTGGDYTLPANYKATTRERGNVPFPADRYLK